MGRKPSSRQVALQISDLPNPDEKEESLGLCALSVTSVAILPFYRNRQHSNIS